MEFLPWKTVDLDGAFRVTAPESISEEVIQEVSNAVTFRFSSATEAVRLEILLTPPWGWEDCFPAEEQKQPPARFICRLISRSTGRRIVVPLEDDGFGLWFRPGMNEVATPILGSSLGRGRRDAGND